MNRRVVRAVAAVSIALFASQAAAQDVLIRNAKVHTATAKGTLENSDVLVRGGKIAAIGRGLNAPGVQSVDAGGKPLTPTLFGGVSEIGIEEVSGEESTVDSGLALGAGSKDMQVRPEFDVTLAYNPASVLVPVARVEGFGWTVLGAIPRSGGSIIGGQGGIVRLDGSMDPIGARMLFVNLGSEADGLSGLSRAAQWMILDQLIDELNGRIAPDSHFAKLTPAGRTALRKYIGGGGRVVFRVHRAVDIVRALRWSKKHNVRIALIGASEAWRVADQIAAAKVPVLVDSLANLPGNFDQVFATEESAARLRAAGVIVTFSQGGDDQSHNARKMRQVAGNAVAHGMSWNDAFDAMTRVPAQVFGVSNQMGSIAVGQRADLVLWTGDPLDVGQVAEQVWLDGRAIPMKSRQTELRDRYLNSNDSALPPAYR